MAERKPLVKSNVKTHRTMQLPAGDTLFTGMWSRNAVDGYLYQVNLSDKVGIGTSTPSEALDVVGNIRASGGIGAGMNPLASGHLFISMPTNLSGFVSAGNNLHMLGNCYYDGSSYRIIRNNYSASRFVCGVSGSSDGSFTFYNAPTGAAGSAITWNTIATLTGSGLVLNSEGDCSITINGDTDNVNEAHNAWLELTQDGGSVTGILGLVGDSGYDPKYAACTGTNGNYAFLGASNGLDIAVGTGVNLKISPSVFYVLTDLYMRSGSRIYFYNSDNSTYDTFYHNGTYTLFVGNMYINGLLTVTGDFTTSDISCAHIAQVSSGRITSPATYSNTVVASYGNVLIDSNGLMKRTNPGSHSRIKKNIKDTEQPLKEFLKLKVKDFWYDLTQVEAEDRVYTGLIIEDVIALGLECLLTYDPQGQPEGIRYPDIGIYLLPLVQELYTRVEALEKKGGKKDDNGAAGAETV